MNRKSLWLVVAAVLAGATLTTIFANTEQGETGARWEYRGVVIRSPFAAVDGCGEIEAELNELGKQGWELVDCEGVMYLLKRPLTN